MIHARQDYNRIQDPALHDSSLLAEGTSPFAADEPVFILRAKDVTAPETLRYWASLQPVQSLSAGLALEQADRMEGWQRVNDCKYADLPGETV